MNSVKSRPVLGIAIPTYNRCLVVEENLKIISNQISNLPVVVHISDNCSEDKTEQVVVNCINDSPQFIYTRNPENIGFDRNVSKLLKLVDADYIWLLGDDDFPQPGAIGEILDILKKMNPDACTLNGISRNGKNQKPKNNRLGKVYLDQNECISDLWWHQSWMSSIVIRKSLLKDFNPENYPDSLFIHLQALHHALASSPSMSLVYDAHPFLSYPPEDDVVNSYTPKALWLFLDRWSYNIDKLPTNITDTSREQCRNQTPFWAGTLFRLRGSGHYDRHEYKKYQTSLRQYRLHRIAWMVAYLPPSFCRALSAGVSFLRDALQGVRRSRP